MVCSLFFVALFPKQCKTIETCTSRSLAHLPYQNHAVDLLPSQMKIFFPLRSALVLLATYGRKYPATAAKKRMFPSLCRLVALWVDNLCVWSCAVAGTTRAESQD